jgi:hypothetical protein
VKSVIDWNEIVPRLKKDLRDTLMLEAVMLLTAQGASKANGLGRSRTRLAAAPDSKLDRQWLREGDGQKLSAPGRVYRVNKKAERQPSNGKVGAVWKHLCSSQRDTISYEGIASICHGVDKHMAASTMICALWERGFIDVAKVAVAS